MASGGDKGKTMTNKQRILQMVRRWPEDISFDEALYHVYVLKKNDVGVKSLESETAIDHGDFFKKLEHVFDEASATAILAKNPPKRPKSTTVQKSKAAKVRKSPPRSNDGGVFCRSCNQSYESATLIRRSWSYPGIRRKGGGPNGARREVWRCCPKGHRLIRVSMRVS
jgi:hypothetical protein